MANVLTRDDAVKENKDPRGIQWAIFPQKGRALYLVHASKKGEDGTMVPDYKYKTPKECDGEWTHSHRAQFAINQYLDRAWSESEAAEARRRGGRKEVEDVIEEQVATN